MIMHSVIYRIYIHNIKQCFHIFYSNLWRKWHVPPKPAGPNMAGWQAKTQEAMEIEKDFSEQYISHAQQGGNKTMAYVMCTRLMSLDKQVHTDTEKHHIKGTWSSAIELCRWWINELTTATKCEVALNYMKQILLVKVYVYILFYRSRATACLFRKLDADVCSALPFMWNSV